MTERERVYDEGYKVAKSEVSTYLGSLLDDIEDKYIEVYTEYGYAPLPITFERVIERLKYLEKRFKKQSVCSILRGEEENFESFDYEYIHRQGYEDGMMIASLDMGSLVGANVPKDIALEMIEVRIKTLKESYDEELNNEV